MALRAGVARGWAVDAEEPRLPSLLEESYVLKDPFTSDKDRFLVLGSKCSVCSRLVCVGPVGMQFILLQEVLPPLCPGEHGRLPSGNPARLGEKESSIKEAGQPAWLSDVSAADARLARAPCTELWGRAGSRRAQPCSGTGRSSVCNWSELGPGLPQEGDWETQRRHSKGRPWTRHPADPPPSRALSMLRPQGRN
ncbi:cysteine-rich DPF motif domain-containing protein 1 isoform X2 [Lontra canadensis]|uniref:cysteine-rich DPF motif domain-containing protein 1 isoform X2 n=1 Tax=Lontra canadensis TaxID=76717 RepID=UPI0013F2CFD7|nr:cysteine-rich DPF motif domain-containing protein 1 isoform X2 [Lontra canadensis]